MGPNSLRYIRGKRKTRRSTTLSLATEVDQHQVDTLSDSRTISLRPNTFNDIDDKPASVIALYPNRIHSRDWKHGSLPKIIRRQADQYPVSDSVLPSTGPSESIAAITTLTSFPITSSTSMTFSPPTATPTVTLKPKGEDPLSSIAVQSILGGLAAVCIIAVVLRCIHVSRQYRAVIEARQRSLERVQVQSGGHSSPHGGVGGTNLIPTSEMTLAARLNMYQARDGARRHYYPYQQEPYGGRDGRAFGSVDSFIAPSYEHDVSPPPFLAVSGKPPAYVETRAIAVAPPPEIHHDPR